MIDIFAIDPNVVLINELIPEQIKLIFTENSINYFKCNKIIMGIPQSSWEKNIRYNLEKLFPDIEVIDSNGFIQKKYNEFRDKFLNWITYLINKKLILFDDNIDKIYNDNQPWLESVIKIFQAHKYKFHYIISENKVNNEEFIITPYSNVDNNSIPFAHTSFPCSIIDLDIEREESKYDLHLRNFFKYADEVIFIDPFGFKTEQNGSNKRWLSLLRVLERFNKNIKEATYYIYYNNGNQKQTKKQNITYSTNIDYFEKRDLHGIKKALSNRIDLRIGMIDRESKSINIENRHDRFILTNRFGLRFSVGLDTSTKNNPNKRGGITLLSHNEFKKLYNEYRWNNIEPSLLDSRSSQDLP